MPFVTSVHESLPYIDPEPTADERAAAEALVAAERAAVPDDPHHALLPEAHVPNFSVAMQAELARVAAKQKLDAIDLARYEIDDDDDDNDDEQKLAQAWTAQAYLRARRTHLALLDSYGKNAWLVGNWQAEQTLKHVDAELAATRRAIDIVTVHRQRAQGDAAAEMQGLEAAWRTGVGRVLETEAAAEVLRQQAVEARRQAA